jgi:hypothetical protein
MFVPDSAFPVSGLLCRLIYDDWGDRSNSSLLRSLPKSGKLGAIVVLIISSNNYVERLDFTAEGNRSLNAALSFCLLYLAPYLSRNIGEAELSRWAIAPSQVAFSFT